MNEATSENKQTQLIAIGERVGLRSDRVHEIAARYQPSLNLLEAEFERAMSIVVTDPDDEAGMLMARKLRLHLRKGRIQCQNEKYDLGTDARNEKSAVDSMGKFLLDSYEIAEAHLQQQEDFAKRIEAKRLDELAAERTEILAGLNFPTNNINVREMNDDEWSFMRDRAQQAFDAEAQKKADAENERLRLIDAAEKARAETARVEELRKTEQAAADAKLKAEQDKAAADRAELARLEREQRAAAEAEEREANEKSARKAALAAGSDVQKLEAWADHLGDALMFDPGEMSSPDAANIVTRWIESTKQFRQLMMEGATRLETAAVAASDAEKQIDGNCPDCGFELTDGECTNEHCPEPF